VLLAGNSEAMTSPSAFVLVSTREQAYLDALRRDNGLRLLSRNRETDQLDVHAQKHGQSLEPQCVDRRQHGTHSVSARSPSREDRSESISSVALAVESADIPPFSEPRALVSSMVDVGIANFSEDNLDWGGQFRYGKSPSFQPILHSKSD